MGEQQAVIREARLPDAASLARLVSSLGYPTRESQMSGRLALMASAERSTLVLESAEGRMLGMIGVELAASYTHDGRQGRITALVVEEGARGRGAGRRLVEAGIGWLAERGARRAVVTTRSDRCGAHQFYRRLGFRQTGYRFALEL